MKQKTSNSLTIRSEVYEGVTDIPHFPIEIFYEDCHLEFEDIYFDDLGELPEQLKFLAESRKGEVNLDGGHRCRFTLSCNAHGGLLVSFRAEPIPFPGQLILKGTYTVDGEYTEEIIARFIKLISEGNTLNI